MTILGDEERAPGSGSGGGFSDATFGLFTAENGPLFLQAVVGRTGSLMLIVVASIEIVHVIRIPRRRDGGCYRGSGEQNCCCHRRYGLRGHLEPPFLPRFWTTDLQLKLFLLLEDRLSRPLVPRASFICRTRSAVLSFRQNATTPHT
jgi:hypothetical protein